MMDFDGNRLPVGDPSRIEQFVMQGQKISRPITNVGELASLVGNDIADMLLGSGNISIFDLPD